MKIAMFTDNFLPQLNGIVVNVLDLAKGLADKGHKVFIIAPRLRGKVSKAFSHPNIAVRRCAGLPLLFYEGANLTLPFNLRILKFLADNKVDVVHVHTAFTIGLQGAIAARLLKLPLVGTFHTFFADRQYLRHMGLGNRLGENLMWKLIVTFYNRCSLIVCSSKGTREELIRRGLRRPLKVIPLAIDKGIFDNSKSKALKKKLNAKGKLVLFVGRVAHEKNIIHLLNCFALALKTVPSAKLVIVGEGPQFGDAKAHISELRIGRNVVMIGRVEHSELVKSGIYGACDVFVTASTTETGPLTVLEAQANGVVCVTARGKGMGLVINGVNGYVVDPADNEGFAKAIVNLLTDKALYNRMRKATLREVERYSADRIVGIWEKTYASLLSAKAHLWKQ